MGAGKGKDGGGTTRRLILGAFLSTARASLLVNKESLRLVTSSERLRNRITGERSLSWKSIPDGVSSSTGFSVIRVN